MSKTLFVIGHTFPEPTTTAAGTRMMQLLGMFQESGYVITFGSTASSSNFSADLEQLDIASVSIELNDASFDVFVNNLHPDVVLFDRFITEEQFGWRIAEQCPDALRILDTEDLHFLRKARQEAVKQGKDASEADLFTDIAKRELASILRCDLSLIISEVEIEILDQVFRIPAGLLYYVPLFAQPFSEEEHLSIPSFGKRAHFISIGNFKHAPNLDAVLQLKQIIWPKIRAQLPAAQLHVYGNYAGQQITQLHNELEGFIVKGWASSVTEVMQASKVLLAPVRFGAGLKGKIIDAIQAGTPTVTTSIGAEGIHGELPFAGVVTSKVDEFVSGAVHLYNNDQAWSEASERAFVILESRFNQTDYSEAFMSHIEMLRTNLKTHRTAHFIGQILQQQTTQATKYLSKWIEEKNK